MGARMTPDTRCVLTFRGRPIAIAEDRERLEEFKADMRFTATMQLEMEITEMVPILK
jgi:hypothetical protein